MGNIFLKKFLKNYFRILYGEQAKYFEDEIRPNLKHTKRGTVSMANKGQNLNGSQVIYFFKFTLYNNLL